METCHLSVPLYNMMLTIVGPEEKTAIKRTEIDICDLLYNQKTNVLLHKRTTGSVKEGLSMISSDMDTLYFFTDYPVVWDLTDVQSYNPATETVILMEYQEHIPGAVYLRLIHMHASHKDLIKDSCIQNNSCTYLSSKLILENTRSIHDGPGVIEHGPCQTNTVAGYKYDGAFGFLGRKWPLQANDWITRCLKFGWPEQQIVESITSSGCDFVPIGSRQSRQDNDPNLDLEWRLSFVQAEQALVRVFNHSQFLCYALLKIFLQEVLNKDVKEEEQLLCSYFLKTAMFWCIQTDPTYKWSRETFFQGFWKCYKLLLKWVYTGYCPNFFIPQNNLFVCKIEGADKERLFTQMYDLYCSGERCLAKCSSLQELMDNYLEDPKACVVSANVSFDEYDHDLVVFETMTGINALLNQELRYDWESLYNVCSMDVLSMSNTEQILITRHVLNLYNQIAFVEQCYCHCKTKCNRNRQIYQKHKKVGVRLLRLTSEFGCASDPLYLALFHYIDGKFRHSLNILEETKTKLYQDYIFYWSRENYENKDDYEKEISGKPMSAKIKAAMVFDINILHFTKFSELNLEINLTLKESDLRKCLLISPFLFHQFLTFLCHHHLASPLADQSLWELNALVNADNEHYITFHTRDIAWDILGICHHLSGNLNQAYFAFYSSLYQPAFHFIHEAIETRMKDVLLQTELQFHKQILKCENYVF